MKNRIEDYIAMFIFFVENGDNKIRTFEHPEAIKYTWKEIRVLPKTEIIMLI